MMTVNTLLLSLGITVSACGLKIYVDITTMIVDTNKSGYVVKYIHAFH